MNQVQISLKLMTGETEVLTVPDDKEEVAKVITQITSGGWLTHKSESKLRLINGNYVVKVSVKSIEGREVIRK